MTFSKRIPAAAATVLGTALIACTPAVLAAENGGVSYDASATSGPAGKKAILGNAVTFRGDARRGTRIAVQRLADGTWTTVATATAGRSNRYRASWQADRVGTFQMRTVPAPGAQVRASSADETVQVTVYKPYVSTWYGKGWYGRRTACGYTLSPTLMGVAHKTLPCGTRVSFLFRGRTVTVPVIDRGPYGKGISWDLTTAAADALGFTSTGKGTVGAIVLAKKR